jgi:integrase
MPRLTKRVVDAAQAQTTEGRDKGGKGEKAGRRILWDSELKGLGFVVHPGGRSTWTLRYFTAEGRDRRMKLGAHGELTPVQARKMAADVLARVRAGEDPLADRQSARTAPTVAESFRSFIEHRTPRWKPGTLREVERIYRREIEGAPIGRLKVAAVTRADVERLHARYAAEGRATTGNRVLAWMSGAFEHAEHLGHLSQGANPCRRVERHAEQRRDRFFSLAELARIGEALAEEEARSPDAVDAIRLLALLGLRRDEVLRLRWAEVDVVRRLLALADTKSGRRLKALGPVALAILERRREAASESEWVFPSRRGGGPLRDIRKSIERVYTAAEIKGATAHHVFRHSVASHAAELGYSELLIAAMLGHRLGSMTARYSHLAIDGLVRAADERVQARIWSALARQPVAEVVTLAEREEART